MSKVEFERVRIEEPGLRTDEIVTRCKTCGWETKKRNNTLYGPRQALTVALLDHRIQHLEGVYDD